VRLIGLDLLSAFSRKHPDARSAVASLQKEIEFARWQNLAELKERYPKASFLGDDHVVFDIRGGSYRAHFRISYAMQIVVVIRLGTHAEYDRWSF